MASSSVQPVKQADIGSRDELLHPIKRIKLQEVPYWQFLERPATS